VSEQTYSIAALAAAAGVTTRTVRYYTAEGLLPPPAARGRYALYGAEHLLRLRAISRLKQAYLPLSEIRLRLQGLSAAQLAELLDAPEEGVAPATAADYVAQVLGQRRQTAQAPESPSAFHAAATSLAEPRASYTAAARSLPHAEFRAAFSRIFPTAGPLPAGHAQPLPDGGGGTGEDVSATQWRRLTLAPGVELHIREPADREAERLVEEILAHARRATAE
jgi:DNA-binding transcriptional MerR regulator